MRDENGKVVEAMLRELNENLEKTVKSRIKQPNKLTIAQEKEKTECDTARQGSGTTISIRLPI